MPRSPRTNMTAAPSLVGRGFVSKADLDRKNAARDAANARVRVAQAQLGAARAQIGRLDIRAPTAGLILSRNVEVGQIVSGGAGGLFRLARGGEMEMRAQLSQQDLARMRVGHARHRHADRVDATFAGSIWQVSPIIDPQSRQGEVADRDPLRPRDPPGRLRRSADRSGLDDRAAAAAKRGAERREGQLCLRRQCQERGRAARIKVGECR